MTATEEFSNSVRWKRVNKFVTHLVVICIIFILPEFLFTYSTRHHSPDDMLVVYAKTAIYIGVFYLNYYFIIPNSFNEKKPRIVRFLLLNLAVVVIAVAIIYTIHLLTFTPPPPKPHSIHQPHSQTFRILSFWVRDAAMMALVILLSLGIKISESWNAREKKHQKLVASQKTEELESLKNQINPHFLFNTLNTIYALIEVSPPQAQQAVHQLSTLLRYLLYENPQKVKLSKEIDFLRSYISLMEMRMGKNVVQLDVDDESNDGAEIAPMLLMPIVENAFKHGNTGIPGHKICVSVKADKDGLVECVTSNYVSEKTGEKSQGGIGIPNLRRRLELIYGKDATLQTQEENGIYKTTLRINTNS